MSDLRMVREFRSELLGAVPPRRPKRRALVGAIAVLALSLGIVTIATGSFPLDSIFPPWFSKKDRAQVGSPRPGTAKVLRIRAPDPGGGPPWGIRLFRTSMGATCDQAGRIVAGRLGFITGDGAFQEAPLTLDACSRLSGGGTLPPTRADAGILASTEGVVRASGAPLRGYSRHPCTADPISVRESFDPRVVICDAPPRRWLNEGTVGPKVVAIELRGPGVEERYPVIDGRYLIVRAEAPADTAGYALFRDGHRENIFGIGSRPRLHEDSRVTRMAAVRVNPARVGRHDPVTVSLRAPRSNAIGYSVDLAGPRGCARQRHVFFTVRTPGRLRLGARVRFGSRPPGPSLDTPRAWCRGRYVGRVVLLGGPVLGHFGFDVH